MKFLGDFVHFRSRPETECQKSIFHEAVESGYVTGYAGSMCNYNEMEIEDAVRSCLPPHDHKLAFCDPNVFDPSEPYSFMKGRLPFSEDNSLKMGELLILENSHFCKTREFLID